MWQALIKNLFLKTYGRLAILVVIGLFIGGGIAVNHYHNVNMERTSTIGSQPKTETQTSQPTSDTQAVASPSPAPSSTPTTAPVQAPTFPDNSAKCISINAQEQTALSALNAQIVQQLQIMKAIIGNSSIDNEILAHGGDINQMLSQSEINETFNQANDTANSLITQYSSTKENYQNQMLALVNSNSPSCSSILKSQLGM